ncbi:MAG: hypothetical protein ACI4SD_07610 [Suilimivivens sp.]
MTVQVPETDYSDASLWAYRPEVHEKDVDVFFVAPTAVGGEEYNMDMADEKTVIISPVPLRMFPLPLNTI